MALLALAPMLVSLLGISAVTAAVAVLTAQRRGELPRLSDLSLRARREVGQAEITARYGLARGVDAQVFSPEADGAAFTQGADLGQVQADSNAALQRATVALQQPVPGEAVSFLPPQTTAFAALGDLLAEADRLGSLVRAGLLSEETLNTWFLTVFAPERARLTAPPFPPSAALPTPAPPAAVAPPAAAGGVVVNVPPIDTGILGRELGQLLAPGLGLVGAGVNALPGSIAASLATTAGPNAHAAQMARYNCQPSFLGPILNSARILLPNVLAGSALVMDTPVRSSLEGKIRELINSQLDPGRFQVGNTYETAVANATDRLMEAIRFGLVAQGISVSAEAMTPLKNMGFSQLAGFMGELSGFQRIGQALVGTVEDAAIYEPLRQQANRRYRQRIPSDQTIALMFQKRSLDEAELRSYFERLGLDETIIKRTPGYIFNDPNPGLLIRAFQVAEPGAVAFSDEDRDILARIKVSADDPDAYFKLKFAKSGLDDTDVKAFVPVVKMGILRREQTIRYEQAGRLFRDGLITEARLRTEVESARVPAPAVEYRLAAHRLQREHVVVSEVAGLVDAAFRRGLLTAAEAQTAYNDLGMDPQRGELRVLRVQVGLAPRQSLSIDGGGQADLDIVETAA